MNGTISITLFVNGLADFIRFPVIPDQIEIRTGLSNNTVEVVSLGEVGIIGAPKLKTITISSFFPAAYAPYCQISQNEWIPPYEAVDKIMRWMESKKPGVLAIDGMDIDKVSFMADEFSYREKGGQPGDVYYDLVLKEYKEMKPRITELAKKADGSLGLKVKSSRTDTRTIPDQYTVKSGDSLYVIAKRFYGDGAKWRELYQKNEATIGNNPNLILPGWVLKL